MRHELFQYGILSGLMLIRIVGNAYIENHVRTKRVILFVIDSDQRKESEKNDVIRCNCHSNGNCFNVSRWICCGVSNGDYVNAFQDLLNAIKSSENMLNNFANATKQTADCCKKMRRKVSNDERILVLQNY